MRIAICGDCRFMTAKGMTLMCRVDNKPVPKNGVCDFNGLGDFLKYRPEYYLAGNKKGPAALGDAGGRGSRKYQEHGQNATGMTTAQAKKCLHGQDDDGNLDFPNHCRKSYIASNAHNNIGQSSILGRFNVRDTVRTRLLQWQGSVTPSLSLFKSLTLEADMPNSHSSPSLATKEKAFLDMAATLATLFNDLQHDFSDIRNYALVTNFFNQLDGTIAFLQSVPSKMETIHKLFPQEGDADA